MTQQLPLQRAEMLFKEMSCRFAVDEHGNHMLKISPFLPESGEAPDDEYQGDPKDGALQLFRQLLIDENLWKVWGPCPTCGKYFIRDTKKSTRKFCSRAHGSDISARTWTKKRLDDEHEAMLKVARHALVIYEQLPREEQALLTWRKFTLDRLLEAGYSRTGSSLTRWVNDEKRERGSGLSLPEHLKIKGDR